MIHRRLISKKRTPTVVTVIAFLMAITCHATGACAQATVAESPTIDEATGTEQAFELEVPGSTFALEMVRIPGRDATTAQRGVAAFYISRVEVPWDLFDAFLYERDKEALQGAEEPEIDAISRPSKPYVPPDRGFGHERFPTISVRFKSALAFCEWLSARTGRTYRLPTIEEFAYAAGGGEPFDPSQLDDIAWYADNADWSTHEIATKRPNGFGLYDMLGNAAEWCLAGVDDEGNPIGALCGGHFDSLPDEVTPDAHLSYDASWQMMDPQVPKSQWWLSDGPFAGFRVVCEIPGEPAADGDTTTAAAASRTSERPNIIFIFSDDHGAQAISAYGSRINTTPNIDRLAAEGMLFANCFCTNALCGPSRAVILTGLHSHLNGFMQNGNQFDASQQTFPRLLQDAGYQTAIFGKWHLGTDPVGFDAWKVLPGQGQYYNPDFRIEGDRVRETGYVTDLITDEAINWLSNARDAQKPFMLMIQHKAPHRQWMPGPDHLTMYDDVEIPEPPTLFDDYSGRASPAANQEMTVARHLFLHYDLKVEPTEAERENLSGPDRAFDGMMNRMTPEQRAAWEAAYGPKNRAFREADLQGEELVRWKYQRYAKDYLRCVASVDDNIGRVLDYLDEAGLAENTVVIYSSDQGWYVGEHGWYDKRWMYEESFRMPLLVRWPGVVEPGSQSDALVQNLDFAQTFLDMADATAPEPMQGASLVPILRGETPEDWRDSVYYHYYEFPAVHMVARHYGVRTDRYKLIHYYQTDEWELFDLKTDPDELNSLYDNETYAPVVARLKQELARLRAHYGDTDPGIKVPGD